MTIIKALAEQTHELADRQYESFNGIGSGLTQAEHYQFAINVRNLATAVLSLWKDSERLADIVNDYLGQINEASLQTFLQMERHRNEDHGLYMNYKITYELMKVKADEIKEALAASSLSFYEKVMGEL